MGSKLETIEMDFEVRFKYPVVFTRGLLNADNSDLQTTLSPQGQTARFIAVFDQAFYDLHPGLLEDLNKYCLCHPSLSMAGDPIFVPGGEQSKNTTEHVDTIVEAVNERGIDRHSYILVFGGGAVIDAVGFAAAIAHRGIRIVRIPTTVLAQNDAAVGVKNSVNAFGKKNFMGTFAPPYAVINDFNFLLSLNQRDWLSGISEAVKVALLKDPDFFNFIAGAARLLRARDEDAMEWVVYRCAQLHLQHIAGNGDPFEMGSSRPLDFGHWAAHKMEKLSSYQLRHGEAVAIGMVLDCVYSCLLNRLDWAVVSDVVRLFDDLGMPTYHTSLDARDSNGVRLVLKGLEEFREHLGGRLTITLLNRVGHPFDVHEIDVDTMGKAIDWMEQRLYPTSLRLAG